MLAACRHASSMIFFDNPKHAVPQAEFDAFFHLRQTQLYVSRDCVRHKQRTVNFDQCWRLDDLNESPKMPPVIAQVLAGAWN